MSQGASHTLSVHVSAFLRELALFFQRTLCVCPPMPWEISISAPMRYALCFLCFLCPLCRLDPMFWGLRVWGGFLPRNPFMDALKLLCIGVGSAGTLIAHGSLVLRVYWWLTSCCDIFCRLGIKLLVWFSRSSYLYGFLDQAWTQNKTHNEAGV